MAGIRRRMNRVVSRVFPEKRLFIQSGGATRYFRLTPLTQLFSTTVAIAAAGWMAVATAAVVMDRVAAEGEPHAVVLQTAYKARLEELAGERDTRAAEARSAQERFQVAMQQVSRQQTALLQSVEERRELAAALDVMRGRLADAVDQREAATATSEKLVAEMAEGAQRAGSSGADLSLTLETVSAALADTTALRDEASAERDRLKGELDDLKLAARIKAERQDEMVEQLEQAVAMSFGPLEKMFKRTDVDVDGLIASVRSTHTGQGGPLGTASLSSRSFDDGDVGARFDQLLVDLDRMNLLRIAAAKVPYAVPVTDGFRFTSGFGVRRDPKGWGRRMHAGVDLAGPVGTPIHAAADGVIVDAGRESGYGNVVRIRHEFGFETVYAHMSKIRVSEGQKVSRGERIGDMGSTGRSTGSHLHYEVHVNGQPVNPMTYLEAAKDVF